MREKQFDFAITDRVIKYVLGFMDILGMFQFSGKPHSGKLLSKIDCDDRPCASILEKTI